MLWFSSSSRLVLTNVFMVGESGAHRDGGKAFTVGPRRDTARQGRGASLLAGPVPCRDETKFALLYAASAINSISFLQCLAFATRLPLL